MTATADTVIPQLAPPDTTALQLLLLENDVDAYVTGWTGWNGGFSGKQTSAGAYVMTYAHGPDARAVALEVLIEAGFVCEEAEATITVHFDRSQW